METALRIAGNRLMAEVTEKLVAGALELRAEAKPFEFLTQCRLPRAAMYQEVRALLCRFPGQKREHHSVGSGNARFVRTPGFLDHERGCIRGRAQRRIFRRFAGRAGRPAED